MNNMEEELTNLLKEYVVNIEKAMKLIYQKFSLTNNYDLICLRTKYHGYVEIEEGTYIFHGAGCRFEGKNFYVDFQFGGKKHYGGIETHTFCNTLMETHSKIFEKYEHITLNDFVVRICNKLVEEGMMYKDQFYFFKNEICI